MEAIDQQDQDAEGGEYDSGEDENASELHAYFDATRQRKGCYTGEREPT